MLVNQKIPRNTKTTYVNKAKNTNTIKDVFALMKNNFYFTCLLYDTKLAFSMF